MPPRKKPFWDRVLKTDNCWYWLGSISVDGYGQYNISVNGKGTTRAAHRISWEEHNGAIPPGMFVLHNCDFRPCVNPKHLFLGTQSDNLKDMDRKGRRVAGRRPGRSHSKLSPEQALDIKKRWKSGGVKQIELAKEYGMSTSAINHIIRGRFWKTHEHMPPAKKRKLGDREKWETLRNTKIKEYPGA